MVPSELEAGFGLLGKEGCALNNQEKKTYLKRYGKADRELDVLYEELALWRSKAEKITPLLRQTPGGGHSGGSQVETAVEKILAVQKEIDVKIDELMAVKQEVVDAVKTVPDETLQLLLSYRYILGMTFEQIAVRMHYNYRWILRLHGRALSAIQLDGDGEPAGEPARESPDAGVAGQAADAHAGKEETENIPIAEESAG